MTDDDSWFAIGKVTGFLGLKGQLKVLPSTNNLQLLLDIESVQIRLANGQILDSAINDVKIQKQMLILSLHDYASRTAAEVLLHAQLFTPKSELRQLEKDEWWVKDLIGLQAFTTDGLPIGRITNIIDGANQLLEITGLNSKEPILVPFVRALVPLVDMDKSRVEIVNLPGLLDQS